MCISEVKCICTRSLAALVGDKHGNCVLFSQIPRQILETSYKIILNKSLTNYPFRGSSTKGGERLLCLGLSVRSSVCPHGTICLFLEGFSRNVIYEYVSKILRENSN